MTSQGWAHGRFQRAIGHRNLPRAEIAAREIGRLSLIDAGLRSSRFGREEVPEYLD